MGGQSSKVEQRSQFSRSDSRRQSKRRNSREEVASIVTYIQVMKTEIQNYNGFREDNRYKEIQGVLANYSQDIQKLRTKKDQKTYDYAQKEINTCIRLLEQKIKENERRLDVDAVESHSFINQNLNKPVVNNKRQQVKHTKGFDTLDKIEQQMKQLEEEINKAISLDFNKNLFIVLEKKIHILYTDLEMISAQAHTPLHERKEHIGRQLIKYNKKLRRAKNTKSTGSREDAAAIRASKTSKDVLREVQNELKTIEVQVNTFNDTKESETFQKINSSLQIYWFQLQDMKNEEDSLKKLKLNLNEKIKYLFNALKEQAAKNEVKVEVAKNKLKNIRQDIDEYKSSDDKANFDDILKLFAERVKSAGDFENVRDEKEAILEELDNLQKMYENEKKKKDTLSKLGDEKNKAKLIFKQLYSSIEDLTHLNDEKPILEVLEAFRDNIDEKLKVLKQENKPETEPIYATPFATKLEGNNLNFPISVFSKSAMEFVI